MAIEGNLELLHLPEILQAISLQGKTGILTVQGENDIVAVSFKDGGIVGADALNQTIEEGLGRVLASRGLVSPRDFEEITEEHEAGGHRLLELLVMHGHVDRRQVLDALRLQTYQLLVSLLSWEEGEFKFYTGQEVAYEEGFEPLSVEELLVRAVSERGEEGRPGLELASLDAVYRRTDGPRVKVIGKHGTDPTTDPSALWLTPDELVVYRALDGERTAREIAESTEAGEYKVLYVLYRLLRVGVVEVARPVAEERAAETGDGPRAEPSTREAEDVASVPGDTEELISWRQRVVSARGIVQITVAAVAVLAVVALLGQPRSTLVSRPWSSDVEESAERLERIAAFEAIDRAIRTYHLLEGRFPDELKTLVESELLQPEALRDGAGRPLSFRSDREGYVVEPIAGGMARPELGAREALEGDFLLDREMTEVPESQQPPLVLLD